jgi:HAMP domain-containing protein/signal transduction histidine kinase/DNA-binding response OmpR family regulator
MPDKSSTLSEPELKSARKNGKKPKQNTPDDLNKLELLKALTAIKNGNFSFRLPIDREGITGKIYDTVNEIIVMNERIIQDFKKAENEIGKKGKLTERLEVPKGKGKWTTGINSLNFLISDLVHPTIEIASVISDVAKGNLQVKMPLDISGQTLKGEFLKIAKEVNDMVKQLNLFSMEVTRVAKEVGSEGKLGGQAKVKGVAGVWKDLTDSVNQMGSNLTAQVRNIAEVTTAVAKGDLSKKITVDVKGEILELKNTINTMVDQLNGFSSEVTRVALEVGTEGKLGGQAKVPGVAGTWKDLTDSVNQMASNLTGQVRNIAEVTTAVAKGDLSKKITVDVKGEILELKNTINTMVDQLNGFSFEVTRVALEVGTEGKLGGQAKVKGVAGVWKDLTDSVNQMASNLTNQVRNLADVTTAVAKGDLSKKITVDVKGEILELKITINTMVDQLNSFASEVTRVAREVGSEGKLGGQATVKGVGGIWKELTDSVNQMASNLTNQVRNLADVTTAVAKGDLSRKITVAVKGEILELKNTINTMVDQLNSFASEVTRVAREVGTEGKLGGQAKVKGVGGVWKDLTDSVNQMGSNLTNQVRNIAEVTTAVAKGDLSRKITVDAKGEIQKLKNTINTMVDQLNSFGSEVTRVAREVGSEGKLGGQSTVKGVGGMWKDLTDSVNQMASNLTGQVRNIAEVTTAVARGDLSRKITVDVKGEILELKNTINTMVDQLNSFSSEVIRVAREVGSEGKLGGQANVQGVGGTWKDLTDSVNTMASNLTGQVRNIAEVTTAVARGDLSRTITVSVKGEILELKNTINTMVDQLNSFASEVTRVAREVGTEGKLGGQANVQGVGGVWKDLTDSVNQMASNLTNQVRNIADVSIAVANGDLSKKITVDVRGEILQLKETINTMVDQLRAFASEVTRVAREVGTDGNLGGQAFVPGVAGTWKDLTDSVNKMSSNLTLQVRNIAEVTKAVASGDLSKKVMIDVKGEILDLKDTINTMVDQLNSFAYEVTRVAREVGTEGKLGGQAEVKGVAGTWKDLTDNVNLMASNLTVQVRSIAQVVTAVAKGKLKQKLNISALGEVAQLIDTINEMIDTLAVFAEQVTTVAREVGVEGQLGGQASVPGASGIWKDLTENVNQLAQNLTTQVRAISEVASAVTKGDLTRTIRVDARGEVEALKDTINQMIANLKETTIRNQEQNWLKSNLAKFNQMLQGQRDLKTVTEKILAELVQVVNANAGAFYILQHDEETSIQKLNLFTSYALDRRIDGIQEEFEIGEGLVGQVAMQKEKILLSQVPDDYSRIRSGLGEHKPLNVIILPVLFENNTKAVIELASFHQFSEIHIDFLGQLTESIGIVLNTIETNSRTEELLSQSQSLAAELKSQQGELRRANDELQDKALLLAKQKEEVEKTNKEVEDARRSLEEKAEQLAMASKYKSEFLANMSHELRTPLNSLLILAQQLYENKEQNLNEKQVKFARTIYSCGDDLIQLINDILDLSKIESGVISANINPVSFSELCNYVETTFKPISEAKKLKFSIETDSELPETMETDSQRLKQILKNLLSNSFKFTEKGEIQFKIYKVPEEKVHSLKKFRKTDTVIGLEIKDTGIGIPKEKQQIIFEAFQQAEGSTSRKYGGTGLGLSISKGLSELLGGMIDLSSEPGKGSMFTLYLPLIYSSANIKEKMVNILGKYENSSSQTLVGNGDTVEISEDLGTELIGIVHDIINEADDDRNNIGLRDKVILVVEDDLRFSRIILEKSHEFGLKTIFASRYNEIFFLANKFKPIAITLDVGLPDTNGWKVLDLIKNDLNLRHIPLYVISGKEHTSVAHQKGARSFLLKPVSSEGLSNLFVDIVEFNNKTVKNLLLLEDNELNATQMLNALAGLNIKIKNIYNSHDAITEINKKTVDKYDCIIIDYSLADIKDKNLLEKIAKNKSSFASVIVYSAKGFADKDIKEIEKYPTYLAFKENKSFEKLIEEIIIHLHLNHKDLPHALKEIVENMRRNEDILKGKDVLIVDDDVRNLFALTSALEKYEMLAHTAESGKEAINIINDNCKIDIVLMDIMMPEMDGYETINKIRMECKKQDLPIIAVTAKAMKGDRDKSIAAGASDYITKPVSIENLLSLMRIWMHK